MTGAKRDISVVIPTYNRANSIALSIQSVLAEGRNAGVDIEVIVVDDGSTDGTMKLLSGMQEVHPTLRVLATGGRMGANAARNMGVAASSSPLVAFNDSDDVWVPGRLASQLSLMRQSAADVAVCGFLRFDQHRARAGYVSAGGGDRLLLDTDIDRLLVSNFVTTQSILVEKSSLIDVGGFDDSLPRFQDWELAIRLVTSCRVVSLDRPGILLYDSRDSISRNFGAGIEARSAMLKKHREIYEARKKDRAFARAIRLRRLVAAFRVS